MNDNEVTKNLADMTRAELDSHAGSVGIDDTSGYKTKDDLIAAIETADLAPVGGGVDPEADGYITEIETDENGNITVPEGYGFDGFGYRKLA